MKHKRFYKHYSALFFDYLVKDTKFINKYDDNNEWKIVEFWSVLIGFNKKKCFDYEDIYYDGHTSQRLTLFWVSFGKVYSYDSRSIESWKKEGLNKEEKDFKLMS